MYQCFENKMHIIKKNNQQLKENERIIGENFHVHKWSLPLSIIYIYIYMSHMSNSWNYYSKHKGYKRTINCKNHKANPQMITIN